jgi:peptide/nickel transport system substrate-binding protein
LGTDSWRVFPDGQMETTYRLKPNLTWHDGTPLSAEDFVFAFQVYAGPELGQDRAAPQGMMRDVVAPDARTVVVRWRQPYPGADSLAPGSGSFGSPFPPMPRHILEEPLRRGNPDAFAAHPYWTAEYVGLGPFRLDKWEPGAFLEAGAFAGYVLGRPKLERVRVLFLNDPNTIVATYLAGEADVSAENALRIEQGVVLRQDWEARGAGIVQFFPSAGRRLDIQFNPERLKTPALLDLRVRRALAHAIDKEALNQGLLEGLGQPSDTWVQPDDEFFPEVQRAVTKYPHDLRLAGQQLAEAGFARGSDGFYASPTTGRLAMQLLYEANPQWDKEAVILEDGLKRFGIDISTAALSRGQARDPEQRAEFPAIRTQGGGQLEDLYGAAGIPTPQNRFQGNNRGSWVHPEYERLQGAFNVTLDRAQRRDAFVQMATLVSDELPAVPLFYSAKVVAYVPQLQGVILGDRIGAYWNVHLWEFR